MHKHKQIPINNLEVGKWYIGRGRNCNIGQWNGDSFNVITECMLYNGNVATVQETRPDIKFEPYYTEDEGCFQPFMMIDEGEMIKPFGSKGWDAHYGQEMVFHKIV